VAAATAPEISVLQAAAMLLFTWTSLVKLIFLLFFAVMILTFPYGDEFKQWAARKPLLRRLFLLSDVPLQASKNIKNL